MNRNHYAGIAMLIIAFVTAPIFLKDLGVLRVSWDTALFPAVFVLILLLSMVFSAAMSHDYDEGSGKQIRFFGTMWLLLVLVLSTAYWIGLVFEIYIISVWIGLTVFFLVGCVFVGWFVHGVND